MSKNKETSNVQKSPKKSNAPIVAVGVAVLCGVALLTYTATTTFVNKLNENADADYRVAYDRLMMRQVQAAELSSEKTITSNSDGNPLIAGYTSDDLVEVDGKWYISSEIIKDDSDGPDSIFDSTDTISVDGVEYVCIKTPETLGITASDTTVPFYGTEYVVVDIDGNMVYLVEKGDTLSTVSGRVGYSVQELAEFNGIKNVNLIYSGQTLRVPAPQEAIDYVQSQNTIESQTPIDIDDTISTDTLDNATENSSVDITP